MASAASHKRALSSGEQPATKKPHVKQPKPETMLPRYAYITISTTKINHGYGPQGGIESVTEYHSAYENREDAHNALRQIANERYSGCEWDSAKTSSGELLLRSSDDEDDDDPEDDVELRVEKLELVPAGSVPKVKLLHPAFAGDEDEDEDDDEEDDDEEDYEDYYDEAESGGEGKPAEGAA